MIIIPIRTDLKLRHTPWVNRLLIAANVIVFLAEIIGQQTTPRGQAAWFNRFMLNPHNLYAWQFFTYQFLHGGWEHLIFNMVFLWVFGNAMEDRLGPVGYLGFYLTGGIVAGLGEVWLSGANAAPVLGASGAISAVTGAFLVLFPFSRVTLTFYFIEAFDVSSIVLVLFVFFEDVIFQVLGIGNVAYPAHISGNVFGFAVAMLLLGTRVLPREPYDLLAIFDRHRFRPGEADDAATPEQRRTRIAEQRAAVQHAVASHDAARAVREYEHLIGLDAAQTLPRQIQLDVAHHATTLGHAETAAHAYTRFLETYNPDPFRDQVELLLGLIYFRNLKDTARARPHLQAAADRLTDPQRLQQARDALTQLDA